MRNFISILAEEGFSEDEIKKAVQFAQNFQGFEKKRFEIAQKSGFKGSITDYESNWEKLFADIIDIGLVALQKQKPKTLRFLKLIRNRC